MHPRNTALISCMPTNLYEGTPWHEKPDEEVDETVDGCTRRVRHGGIQWLIPIYSGECTFSSLERMNEALYTFTCQDKHMEQNTWALPPSCNTPLSMKLSLSICTMN